MVRVSTVFLRPLPIEMGAGSSLRVQATPKDEIYFYRDRKFFKLDGSPVRKLRGDFYRELASAFSRLEETQSGSRLLRILESSRYPLVVSYGKWMTYDATRDGKSQSSLHVATGMMFAHEKRVSSEFTPIDQLGVGGRIVWDPSSSVLRMEVGGVSRAVPNHVTLAHEMFHAYDGIRGLLDRRLVFPSNRYETIEVGEYRAMYFENIVRKETGFPYAIHYGTYRPEEPGLLDSSGEPIWFPSPCLDEI